MPKAPRLSPQKLRLAEQHLSQADKVMSELIGRVGTCRIVFGKHTPFHTLVNSIISQQLSTKAAATIAKRVTEVSGNPFTPEGFQRVTKARLRKAGLSEAKAKYILELARCARSGKIDFNSFGRLDDEEVIEALVSMKGVGRWTAEMFLIFALGRPNVVSPGDAGLQRAVKLLYGPRAKLEKVCKVWQPYRSVASWYLWRHLDAMPIKRKLS